MEKRNNKNKKRLLILVALVGVMGIGGVVAATSITINGGSPLSLGAGYATATTCDENVTIAASQAYDTSSSKYGITALTVTGVDISYTNPTTGLGCANKVMQLAYVVTGNTATSASWTLASAASADSRIYRFGPNGLGTYDGTYYNASVALATFDMATLLTVALSIA